MRTAPMQAQLLDGPAKGRLMIVADGWTDRELPGLFQPHAELEVLTNLGTRWYRRKWTITATTEEDAARKLVEYEEAA